MTVDEIKKKYQADAVKPAKNINSWTFDFPVTASYRSPLIRGVNDVDVAKAKAIKMAENILKKNGFYDIKCTLR